jgi:hypothetical protein
MMPPRAISTKDGSMLFPKSAVLITHNSTTCAYTL